MIDTDAFSAWIGLETAASKQALSERLSTWTSDPATLQHLRAKFIAFKRAYKKDPTFFPRCKDMFKEIAGIETQLGELMSKTTTLEEETYNELLFLKPFFTPFNFIPWMLSLWAILRVYLLPGLALFLPVFILIIPYIILTYVMRIPITFSNYTNILHSVISGNLDFSQTGVEQDLASTLKQCMVVGVTIAQGVIQPYWNYIHLHSVDTIIRDNGRLILRYKELYTQLHTILEAHGFVFFTSPLPDYTTEREATARVILQSNSFLLALRYIGSLEVIMTLASHPSIHSVTWLSSHPQFHGKDIFDFQVQQGTPISVHLDKKRHALLTGPNKGGKSTVLRAITTCMVLAHTYGCALGHVGLTPFHALHVCLKPDDLPGSKSRFEREIEFTAQTLKPTQPIMVLIDELYHSTNPPDAKRSCDIYCTQLWKKPNVVSVISTHLFDFVESADPMIQRLCCPAQIQNGVVRFMYGLDTGVCTISSVDLLLEKNGLSVSSMDASHKGMKIPMELQNDVQ
jgi:hypothetical protein